MPLRWGWFSQRSSKYLKTGWLMSVGLVAVYAGWIKPLNSMRGIPERRATGLAGIASERVGWAPEGMWQQTSPVTATSGVVTGDSRRSVRRRPTSTDDALLWVYSAVGPDGTGRRPQNSPYRFDGCHREKTSASSRRSAQTG